MDTCTVRQTALTVWLMLAVLPATPGSSAGESFAAEREMSGFCGRAREANPALAAAVARLEEQRFVQARTAASLDPVVTAGAGWAEDPGAVPWAGGSAQQPPDAFAASLGVELAVPPGAYVNIGLAERYLRNGHADFDRLYQSLFGAQVRVPLARNRRFLEWHARTQGARSRVEAARDRVLVEAQSLRHAVETAYLKALLARADAETVSSARDRARRLLADAEALSQLKVIPEYQVLTARMEVHLTEEQLLNAEVVYETHLIELGRWIGVSEPVPIRSGLDDLIDWSSGLKPVERVSPSAARAARGVYREQENQLRAELADGRLAVEQLRPELTVSAAFTWQGENPDGLFGDRALLRDERTGGEVAVVWRFPWGGREAAAERLARRRREDAAQRVLEEVGLLVAAQQAAAHARLVSDRKRLARGTEAVSAAQAALAAEEERFRLGEGRSRNVLDAQKDLTQAVLRRNQAAASLLQAAADYRYACGYDSVPGAAPQDANRERGIP